MNAAAIVIVLLGVASLLTLAGLTMVGQRRRGGGPAVVAAAGLFFPFAWIAWYRSDELPIRRATHPS